MKNQDRLQLGEKEVQRTFQLELPIDIVPG